MASSIGDPSKVKYRIQSTTSGTKKFKKTKEGASVEDKKDETKDDEGSITDDIRNADFYHGLIPKTDAEALLKKEGDFVLRKTEHNTGVIVLCISVRVDAEKVKHFVINTDAAKNYFIDVAHKETTVSNLINFYKTTKNPLSAASGAKLRKAVERPPWAINHDAIFIMKKLGQGAFGEVYLAEYVSEKGREKVAVKTMKGEASRDARNKFLKEARMMRKYDHKNVVRILGVAVHEHPLMIAMECCEGGAMSSYLKKNGKTMPMKEKNRFVAEAAEGLSYLEKQQCIHRDIAARNCLLSGKNNTVKISDFGMSDDKAILHDDTLEKVPVKWLAPETLQDRIYSLKSDVWAFGVLVWEIYSNGAEPYPGLSRLQTRAKIVLTDYRMKMPDDTPAEITKIVTQSWDKVPDKRPAISAVLPDLKKLADK
ncbi:hypothetical protein PFISCL1PPCAC_19542 [Pristionchus fissidentatus]|uniref:Tyrosine-protein kinase n=1 Tax=Pristionchus fissidentatus TaxID=1538716 RepID=A0AAV5WCV1_9BILA|nr:hypothetical protein PFISCL1PPCAC_19542 [Pristionchus fissidentatus]